MRRFNKVAGRRAIELGAGKESTAIQGIGYNLIEPANFIGMRKQKREGSPKGGNTSPWKQEQRQIYSEKRSKSIPVE